MMKKNYEAWVSSPAPQKENSVEMSIEQMINSLDERTNPEMATLFGEIKGLYTAYKLAPSTILLETIVAKCLTAVLQSKMEDRKETTVTPIKSSRTHPSSMDWEWVQGFEHFLMLNGISDNSRPIYIRALKRVMKKYNVTDVETLKENITFYINEYNGRDQASHNAHISALRQFRNFMDDECGYFFSIEKDGEEEIISRIYCNHDLACQEFEELVIEYRDTTESIKMYDKFSKLIKAYSKNLV